MISSGVPNCKLRQGGRNQCQTAPPEAAEEAEGFNEGREKAGDPMPPPEIPVKITRQVSVGWSRSTELSSASICFNDGPNYRPLRNSFEAATSR